jgi:phospholipase C
VRSDLTSAFNFANPNAAAVDLPDTTTYVPTNHDRHPDYVPAVPANQSLPKQEGGLRRARALLYQLRVDGVANAAANAFRIEFKNTGRAGVCFQVRSGNAGEGPRTFTVEDDKALANSWSLAASHGKYDLSVFGPNGFLRQFRGVVARNAAVDLDVDVRYDVDDYALVLRVTNQAHGSCRVTVASAYDNTFFVDMLPRGRGFEKRIPLRSTFGWYDLTVKTDGDASFLRRIAGRARWRRVESATFR